jgi:uncharacterized RDD family membrane protein YckC
VEQPLERSAFAGFSIRLAAGLIDWLIVFAALWIAVITEAVVGLDSPVSVVLSFATGLLPLLYFGLSWTRSGQTVGMGSNNIQMVDTRTWEPPSWIRAFLRALVAVLTFVACWLPLVVAFSDAPESNSRAAAIAAVAIAFAALALIGHLWSLRDPRRQSLQDRLFGLAVVHAKPQEERLWQRRSAPEASLGGLTRRRDDDPERPPKHRPARDRRPA